MSELVDSTNLLLEPLHDATVSCAVYTNTLHFGCMHLMYSTEVSRRVVGLY